MSSLLDASEITHEQEVVWLEDPSQLDYVRQALDTLHGCHVAGLSGRGP